MVLLMDLKKHILRKLFRRRIVGGKHTAVEHVMSGLPVHAQGEAKKATEDLIREGLLIPKPTGYGLQISINPERLEEIKRILQREAES